MDIERRPGQERGQSQYGGWLQSYHSFSFADYVDPAHVHFSVLRVLNDDTVAAGAGFPAHPHRDMEIISYVTRGGLEHRDSMGNGSIIHAGDFQRMSAGTGVVHSEFNASDSEPVHFFQIWILPNQRHLPPSYEQRQVSPENRQGRLFLVASGNNKDDALHIHQDCRFYVSRLGQNETVSYSLAAGRCAYVHVTEGEVVINGLHFNAGDGARIRHTDTCTFSTDNNTEFLLFDLP